MKRNTRWYLSAAAAGALLAGAALWAARTFPAAPAAVPGFFGLAGGLLFFCAMAELLSTRDLDPARRERDREDHDERGAMIRAGAERLEPRWTRGRASAHLGAARWPVATRRVRRRACPG